MPPPQDVDGRGMGTAGQSMLRLKGDASLDGEGGQTYEIPLVIKNLGGLHTHPSAALVRLSASFECDIRLKSQTLDANAKSIMGAMSLAVDYGTEVWLSVRGDSSEDAVIALNDLFDIGFGRYSERLDGVYDAWLQAFRRNRAWLFPLLARFDPPARRELNEYLVGLAPASGHEGGVLGSIGDYTLLNAGYRPGSDAEWEGPISFVERGRKCLIIAPDPKGVSLWVCLFLVDDPTSASFAEQLIEQARRAHPLYDYMFAVPFEALVQRNPHSLNRLLTGC